MAGETTSFFANSIFSGINQGLQGRRALKEEERLRALKQQEEERLRELSRQKAAEDRANKIADYQQEQEIAQNIKNRAFADRQEQMINTAAVLGRETNNPNMVYSGIAKAFGLDYPIEKSGANAHNSRGASSNLKAIKSDDRLKKLQELKALRDYMDSVSERRDEFGNIIPAQLSPADLYELGLLQQGLARDLYGTQATDDEQSAQGSPNGTPTLSDAEAILFGLPGGFNKQKTEVSAPPKHDEVPNLPPETLTVSMVPPKEPTIYGDVANVAGKMHDTFVDNLKQGRRAWGSVYDAFSAPTTPEDYSRLSALQKLIYKFTGINIRPRRLEDLIRLNKER